MSIDEKIEIYEEANREVAILCNHQKSVSKSFKESVKKMDEKIKEMKAKLKEYIKIKKDKKQIDNLKSKIKKHEKKMVDKVKYKSIATGTSKLNYNDPRITGKLSGFFLY
jgi:DNA topoisomerase-1